MAFSSAHSWLAELGWADRFELLDRIGSGGMGQVWRARERGTDRIVALKTLDPSKSGDDHLLARLDIEATTLIKLRDAGQHDNVVPIIDFKVSDTHACLVMEFIPGLNLRKWCDTHQLDLAKRVELIAQVARATGWFHALDVIHRDLKPANILVNAVTHQPIIVDFSIAKLDDTLPLTLTNEALGTAPYMAPEQLDRSLGPISAATDVYALGVTLYELLTHILPHPGELPQIIQRHQNEVRPACPSLLNKEVPRDLESICLKALSHRPQDRYANGEHFAADLERFRTHQPIIARPLSTVSYLARQAQRRPALSAAVAICVSLMLALTWGIRRAAAERHLHDLESRVVALTQARAWPRESLQQADSLLAELAHAHAEQSYGLEQAVTSDVVKDIEAALLEPYLKPEDLHWIQADAVPWLQIHAPQQSLHFAELIAERLRRWKPVAVLNPPFKDADLVFGPTTMRIEGGLLFPNYDSIPTSKENDPSPSLWLATGATQPLKFTATFPAPASKASGLRLTFEFQSLKTTIHLVSPRDASDAVLSLTGDQHIDPDGVFLVGLRHGKIEACQFYERSMLSGTFFTISVELRSNQLDAAIEGVPGVHLEDLFAFASSTQQNRIGISWPRGLGLHGLGIYTRPRENWSQMEMGDLLYNQGKLSSALGVYEALKSVPGFDQEARYKAALMQSKQNAEAPALTDWEQLSAGPPCLWKSLSIGHLWADTAEKHGMTLARPYLTQLPDEPKFSKLLQSALSKDERKMLLNTYQQVGHGLNCLRNNVENVADALKALKILGLAPIETAVNLATALHFNGLDAAASDLLSSGLRSPGHNRKDSTERSYAITALDHWTRITRSENDNALRTALSAWSETFPETRSYKAIAMQEQARVHARAGELPAALTTIQGSHAENGIEPRLVTSSWLLEGMLHRLLGDEANAHTAWHSGIASAEKVSRQTSVHLSDLIVLHSLAKTWNRETVTQVMTPLMGKGQIGSRSLSIQSAFVSGFLATDEFTRSLNTLCDHASGQELARHTALRSKPARELVRAWYALIMERYFLSSALVPDAFTANHARVRSTVDHLIEAIASGQDDESAFFAYIGAWTTPLALPQVLRTSDRYPKPLVARLKWLLAQRYLTTHHEKEAHELLTEIKDEPSLDAEWRAEVTAQLGQVSP